MGREIQKKKNRSGIQKIRQKPKSRKPPALSNPLIAAHWDKSQTLAQNYSRLGLARKLNGHTGGVDPLSTKAKGGSDVEAVRDLLDVRATRRGKMEAGRVGVSEGRVVRDKEGRIVEVVGGSDVSEDGGKGRAHWARPLVDPLNALDDDREEMGERGDMSDSFEGFGDEDRGREDRAGHLQHFSSGFIGAQSGVPGTASGANAVSTTNPDSIIGQLSSAAALPGGKKKRKQSEREKEWCEALLAKHGRDYAAMARDAKLNVMQQSVGDVKRRVNKYLKSEHDDEED